VKIDRKLVTLLQQTFTFLQRPSSIVFLGGSITLLFYSLVVGHEWHNNVKELQSQLKESKQKWEVERLSLDAKLSRLELKLNRTEVELVSILESFPKNDGKWSRTVIESKYAECMENKKQ